MKTETLARNAVLFACLSAVALTAQEREIARLRAIGRNEHVQRFGAARTASFHSDGADGRRQIAGIDGAEHRTRHSHVRGAVRKPEEVDEART